MVYALFLLIVQKFIYQLFTQTTVKIVCATSVKNIQKRTT